jgi:hypothetical protein
VPGWGFAGRTSKLSMTDRSLRLYDALVRFWRPVEELLRPPVGLSLEVRARKPSHG